MNDKIRAEFEAAIAEKFGMPPDQLIAADEDPEGTTTLIHVLWWTWQASREAVVVTLPETEWHECEYGLFKYLTPSLVENSIEAAGIKVAP